MFKEQGRGKEESGRIEFNLVSEEREKEREKEREMTNRASVHMEQD